MADTTSFLNRSFQNSASNMNKAPDSKNNSKNGSLSKPRGRNNGEKFSTIEMVSDYADTGGPPKQVTER